jgi:DNA-binding NarL/FixJ family response regulator
MDESFRNPHQVLIVSANPLFREGLRKVYARRWIGRAVIAGVSSSMEEAFDALESLQPDLVILDYDDKAITRETFLNHFVMNGQAPMKVFLVSLRQAGLVVIYDRRCLTSAQAENWLNDPWREELTQTDNHV